MADIARIAGVSERVVSKVLFPGTSNSARAGKTTAERVRKVAKELGYLPNQVARQLAGGRSFTFGVIIQTPMIPIHLKLLAELEIHASRHNYRLMIGQVKLDNAPGGRLIQAFINDLASRRVDGVISLLHEGDDARLQEIYRPIQNIVFLTTPVVKWADWVGTDLAEGTRLTVQHLYEQGRRNIVLFQPKSLSAPFTERLRGFESAVRKLRLPRSRCFHWSYELESHLNPPIQTFHPFLSQLFEKHPETDAIIALNDLVAMHVIQYLHEQKLEVAVIGFDNQPLTAATVPPLTSVDQRMEEVAAKAIELLLRRIEEPDRPVEAVRIKPKLYPRESSTFPIKTGSE